VTVHNAVIAYKNQNPTCDHFTFRLEVIITIFERYAWGVQSHQIVRPSVNPLLQRLTERHFIEKIPATGKRKLSLKNDVWCVKNGAKGRTVCIGVPTAKLDCVWIPASKFFTPWITSKFQPLKIVSIYIYVCVCVCVCVYIYMQISYSLTVITINVLIIITENFIKFGSVVSSVN
jgi:hypothetical protein